MFPPKYINDKCTVAMGVYVDQYKVCIVEEGVYSNLL